MLRELHQTMLSVLNFWTNTMDEVTHWVWEMDEAQNSNYMVMGVLQLALPREENL